MLGCQLRDCLGFARPAPSQPLLLEEFIVGEEHSFDSIFVHGRPVWHSISRYLPSPLTVLREPWIQWCVLLPRTIDGPAYGPIREAGFAALADDLKSTRGAGLILAQPREPCRDATPVLPLRGRRDGMQERHVTERHHELGAVS